MSLLRIAILIFLLYLAALTVAAWGWLGFSMKKELDPVTLTTLVVNVFIALVLQRYFTKTAGEQRAEKDLVIEGAKECLAFLKQCGDAMTEYHEGKQDAVKIKRRFRDLSNSILALESAVTASHCNQLQAACKDLQTLYYEYHREATGGSFPAKPFTAPAIVSQRKSQRALQKKLQLFIFEVNSF